MNLFTQSVFRKWYDATIENREMSIPFIIGLKLSEGDYTNFEFLVVYLFFRGKTTFYFTDQYNPGSPIGWIP